VITAEEALAPTQTEWGSSRWGAFNECRRKHSLRYHLRVVPARIEIDPFEEPEEAELGPEDDSYFTVGTICHAVLRYVEENLDTAIGGRNWKVVLAAAEKHPVYGKDLGAIYEADRLMTAYWSKWGFENAGWPDGTKLIGVEKEIVLPAGTLGPKPYTNRADTLLQYPDGSIVIVDTKTRRASIPGTATKRSAADPFKRARFARGLQTRPQFLGLSASVQRAFKLSEPPELLVNAIVKTKTPAFDRVLVKFPPKLILAWEQKQSANARELAGNPNDASPNFASCAPEMGRQCEYFQFCWGSDEEQQRFYTKEKAA
jgi:PD-(D/E)XK nuclease superfamily protein